MRQIRLLVEYDGSGFSGWQSGARRGLRPRPPESPLPEGAAGGGRPGRSVQDELERAVGELTGKDARVVAAGRTDAGASAEGQVACFRTSSSIPPDRFAFALNSLLPEDVTVLRSEEAPPEFHPRKSAKTKLYRYVILNRTMRPALGRRHLAHVSAPLDVEAMREAARALVGTHDFTSFAAREATLGRNAVRTIRRLDLRREGERIVVEVEGTGFLMHMVRTIAGSLVEVGRGREEPGWIARVLDARSREAAGPTAPPGGLTLVRVGYD